MYFAGYKENNTLNKVLLICLLAFVFVLIISSNCFAFDFDYNSSTVVLPDIDKLDIKSNNTYENYIIFPKKGSIDVNNLKVEDFYLIFFNDVFVNSSNQLDFVGSYYRNSGNKWAVFGYDCRWTLDVNKYNLNNYFSTTDIFNVNNELVFSKTSIFNKPFFITSKEELESGNFEALKISAGSLSNAGDSFILNIYNSTYMGDNVYSDIKYKSFMLDEKSSYWNVWDLVYTYVIPVEKLGIDISNGKRYIFELVEIGEQKTYDSVTFTVGGLTAEEEMKNKLDEQTEAIKENTETNKGIWETIKDILSYINPFSENFFVYKLIELLVDSIKSLFIPSNDFFSTYFTDLKDWFSDRLGFLFYPFELIIDILTKISNINFSEPIFNIPNLYEPFTNSKLISATTFNLNSILENNAFSTLHNIYLICVDAFIVFELVNLFKRKYEEVTTK